MQLFGVEIAPRPCQTPPVFHVGRVVRMLREQRGWSSESLAERAGISPTTLSKIENGHGYRQSTMVKLAKTLGVTPAELYTLESEQRVRIRSVAVSQLAEHKDIDQKSQPSYTAPPSPTPESVPGGAVVMADTDSDREELLHCFSLMSADQRATLLYRARVMAAASLTDRNRGGFEARQRKKTGG